MSIKVFGAGFGRTGTMSLKGALEQLGFGPCYHMIEVIEHPEMIDTWYRAACGDPLDFSVFDGYHSIVDWPAANYWREITAHYPEAKVILSTRDPESWYKSVSDTIYKRITRHIPEQAPQERHRHRAMTKKTVLENTFDNRFDDKAYAIDVFERHNAAVQAAVDPSRLLVFSVKEGWEPLCRFLEVPVPSEPFPRLNDTESFLTWVGTDDAEDAQLSRP